jgi:hypothetical protein
MIKKGTRRRAVAIGTAAAAGLLLTLATSSAASADPMRTLNLTITCSTGPAYGLQVQTSPDGPLGWYQPSGSSQPGNGGKLFTVSIPAATTTLSVMPLGCYNQPFGSGPVAEWSPAFITAGTGDISANAFCEDYDYNYGGGPPVLIMDCSISSVTYS